jgi:hypothetical protein
MGFVALDVRDCGLRGKSDDKDKEGPGAKNSLKKTTKNLTNT